MQHPAVNLIFAGNWTNYQQQEATLISATQSLLSGPYLSGLTQYGSDGTASYGATPVDPTTPLVDNPTGSQLQAFLQTSITTYGPVPGNYDVQHDRPFTSWPSTRVRRRGTTGDITS